MSRQNATAVLAPALLARSQSLGELTALCPTAVLDSLNHASRAFEIEQRVLKLAVDYAPIRHHDDRREHLVVVCIVQLGKEMRGPRNRRGFAAACGVLDQVCAASALIAHLLYGSGFFCVWYVWLRRPMDAK